MKKRLVSILTALSIFLFLNQSATANIRAWNKIIQEFISTGCQNSNSCDLKRFTVISEDYEVILYDDSSHLGTRLMAEYETDSVETLTKYGLVQFIRGCKFTSNLEDDGSVTKELAIEELQFGTWKKFCFPNWVIASLDKDPFYYNKFGDKPRYNYYRWNLSPRFNNRVNDKFFGDEQPPFPRLHVYDLPGTASATGNRAYNTSLEFKMCIYKTADIPTETTEDNINFAKPIHCFNWKSSFIYNHALGIFETKDALDPFCLEEEKKENK